MLVELEVPSVHKFCTLFFHITSSIHHLNTTTILPKTPAFVSSQQTPKNFPKNPSPNFTHYPKTMQLHCETSLISSSTSNFPFSVNPISYSSSNRISFPFSYSFSTLKARATLNNGGFTKPISEMTFYDLLGIPQNVSLIEIKQAYKQLARKYHPDVSPPDLVDEYTHRFIRVQEAYEVLSDPRTRAIYDRDMARGLHLAFSARKNFDLQVKQSIFSFFFEFFQGLLWLMS